MTSAAPMPMASSSVPPAKELAAQLAAETAPKLARSLPELMRAYCAGELDAFCELYAACAPAVRAHLQQRLPGGWCVGGGTTGTQRPDVPSDDALAALLDQTFLELHQRRSMYVLGADPRRWLLQLAEGVVARERRRNEPGWFRRGLSRLGRGNVPALRGAS